MPNPIEFQQRILSKYPDGVTSDGKRYADLKPEELTQRIVSKFPDGVTNDGIKYSDFLKPEIRPAGKFPVAPKPIEIQKVDRAKQIAGYKAEDANSQAEAKKQGSVLGIVKNTLKGFGGVIASAEVGLANSMRKIFGNQGESYSANISTLGNSQNELLKRIRENKAKGKDTSRLEAAYNGNQDALKESEAGLEEEQNLPTKKQVVGQVIGTGLDALTAGTYKAASIGMKSFTMAPKVAPSVYKAVTKPVGAFTKTGGKRIATGAGIGYGYDIGQGLQGDRGEDRTGAKAFIPGAATAFGAAIPALTEGSQSIKNVRDPELKAAKIISKREKELQKLEDSYSVVRKTTENAKKKGIDSKKILAQTDLLTNSVDETGTIRTQNAIQELTDFIDPQESVISKNLEREGKTIPLSVVAQRIKQTIAQSGLEGGALERALLNADSDIAGYMRRVDKDGNIPLHIVHRAKVDKYRNINYLNPESKRADKVIAKVLKSIVEETSDAVDVKKLNEELGAHYSVLSLLEKLDGKKVEGGKLGRYFAKTIGSIVGSHFGPLGSIIGAEAAGRIRGSQMAGSFGSKLGRKPVQSDAMRTAVEKGNSPLSPLEMIERDLRVKRLPAPKPGSPRSSVDVPINLGAPTSYESRAKKVSYSSSNLGSRKSSQRTTTTPMINDIKSSIPQVKKISKPSQSTNGLNFEKEIVKGEKRLVIDLFPNDEIKGKGIVKTQTLSAFRDSYADGHTIVEPSYGMWTKEGKGFIESLKKDGYIKQIENRGGVERYEILPVIKESAQNKTSPTLGTKVSEKGSGDVVHLVKRAIANGDPQEARELWEMLPNNNKYKQGMRSFFTKVKKGEKGSIETGPLLGVAGVSAVGAGGLAVKNSTYEINIENPKVKSDLERVKENIAKLESAGSGDYQAVADTGYGDKAIGRYQVRTKNLPEWSKKYLGRVFTPQEFLNDPEAQDALFIAKMAEYVEKYGNIQRAAAMWFSGRPDINSNKSDRFGKKTIKEYVFQATK